MKPAQFKKFIFLLATSIAFILYINATVFIEQVYDNTDLSGLIKDSKANAVYQFLTTPVDFSKMNADQQARWIGNSNQAMTTLANYVNSQTNIPFTLKIVTPKYDNNFLNLNSAKALELSAKAPSGNLGSSPVVIIGQNLKVLVDPVGIAFDEANSNNGLAELKQRGVDGIYVNTSQNHAIGVSASAAFSSVRALNSVIMHEGDIHAQLDNYVQQGISSPFAAQIRPGNSISQPIANTLSEYIGAQRDGYYRADEMIAYARQIYTDVPGLFMNLGQLDADSFIDVSFNMQKTTAMALAQLTTTSDFISAKNLTINKQTESGQQVYYVCSQQTMCMPVYNNTVLSNAQVIDQAKNQAKYLLGASQGILASMVGDSTSVPYATMASKVETDLKAQLAADPGNATLIAAVNNWHDTERQLQKLVIAGKIDAQLNSVFSYDPTVAAAKANFFDGSFQYGTAYWISNGVRVGKDQLSVADAQEVMQNILAPNLQPGNYVAKNFVIVDKPTMLAGNNSSSNNVPSYLSQLLGTTDKAIIAVSNGNTYYKSFGFTTSDGNTLNIELNLKSLDLACSECSTSDGLITKSLLTTSMAMTNWGTVDQKTYYSGSDISGLRASLFAATSKAIEAAVYGNSQTPSGNTSEQMQINLNWLNGASDALNKNSGLPAQQLSSANSAMQSLVTAVNNGDISKYSGTLGIPGTSTSNTAFTTVDAADGFTVHAITATASYTVDGDKGGLANNAVPNLDLSSVIAATSKSNVTYVPTTPTVSRTPASTSTSNISNINTGAVTIIGLNYGQNGTISTCLSCQTGSGSSSAYDYYHGMSGLNDSDLGGEWAQGW